MTSTATKTRFCPSPTGLIHLGNTRTALFNLLLARHNRGLFLLRIEDTDPLRSKKVYVEALLDDMRWLGLDWQEGPFHQSERQGIYDQYYEALEKSGEAYPCFCTEEQLAVARKLQRAMGKPPRYAGGCFNLTQKEISEKIDSGLKPTLRFKVPEGKTIVFEDLVRGTQRFLSDDLGDFIIRRGDGTSPFMFCNAIDDALMGVTHALRGEDHLTNTPRQVMILEAVGLTPPQYGHIALIHGTDGAPLSKRNGSRSAQDLREAGYLPSAVINYLARLGHYYEDNRFMDLDALAAQFRIENLGKSPARFDESQLLRWQKEGIAALEDATLWQWMGDTVHALVPEKQRALFIQSLRPNVVFPSDAAHWASVLFEDMPAHDEAALKWLQDAGPKFFTVALQVIDTKGADYNGVCAALKTELGVKGKTLFMPLRVAITGQLHGPELVHLFELLGVERLRTRLQKVAKAV